MGPRRAFLQCADIKSVSSVAKTMLFVVSAVAARAPVHSYKAVWEELQESPLPHGTTHSAITGQAYQACSRQNNKIFPVCFIQHAGLYWFPNSRTPLPSFH